MARARKTRKRHEERTRHRSSSRVLGRSGRGQNPNYFFGKITLGRGAERVRAIARAHVRVARIARARARARSRTTRVPQDLFPKNYVYGEIKRVDREVILSANDARDLATTIRQQVKLRDPSAKPNSPLARGMLDWIYPAEGRTFLELANMLGTYAK